ncbi:MAG: DNA repair protein RecO [Desulfobulbaceae bacterium]|nr:DNA repair protein RecO [Desulfobulbaceae bacterium]
MKEQHTSAVVIRVLDHGESDKIVTFYCPELGRLTGIAKGAKRSKKRFVNKLELFSQLQIRFAGNSRSSLVRIDQAELVNAYPVIRSNYSRYTAATLIGELMLHSSRENDGDPKVFKLLVWSLAQLNKGKEVDQTIILFQIRMLALAGYQPMLKGCVRCGRIDPGVAPFFFLASRNGFVCRRCNREKTQTLPLALSTIKLLQLALDLPLEKIDRLRFSSRSRTEAMELLKRYSTSLLQREIHSWDHLAPISNTACCHNNG